MVARLRVEESVPEGFRRIIASILEQLADRLGDPSLDHAQAFHETRRSCKRIRALLRLLRPDLGDRFYLEDRWYRDVGRALAASRDATVMMETLDALAERYREVATHTAFDVTRSGLSAHAEVRGLRPKRLRRRAIQAAEDGRVRIERLELTADGRTISRGYADTYAKGLAAYGRCSAGGVGRSKRFHELRKWVKALYYQSDTLLPVAPLPIGGRRDEFDQLGEILGLAQDLCVLRRAIRRLPEGPEAASVSALAGVWERELHVTVLERGARLFADPRKEVERSFAVQWDQWRRHGAAAPQETVTDAPKTRNITTAS